MIVYQSTKEGFLADVINNQIDTKIEAAFYEHLGRYTSPNEVLSWTNSMLYMSHVLRDPEIADDAGISIEFQIPLTSQRVDFIITGLDQDFREQVIIIELKQWSTAKLTDKDAIVRTRFQYGETETVHPSYQAWSYAALIESYNQTVQEDNINLVPCAYLHNYNPDDVITNPFYNYHLKKAPVFLRPDALKLNSFIKKYVKYGDQKDILYKIENGRLRPSKQLADSIVSMISGNQEFIMIDEQKEVYETALSYAAKARSDKKYVLIIEGGPGTGKSVVAINLLAELTNRGQVTRYVSKNAAPRAVYKAKLSGTFKRRMIDNLFGGSGEYCDVEENIFDTLIVDEAHRLNLKSGLYQNRGENQIVELIRAAKFIIFFIDDDQQIHIKDIGESSKIEQLARQEGALVQKLKLKSQFRCNGSDGYLAWLDNTLQIKNTANIKLSEEEFDFRIVDSPKELQQIIEKKNELNNKSRLVAGYCWDWVSKRDPSAYDIVFPEFDFKMRWNLTKDGSTWIIAPDSIKEIGCIHTCQGLELDYVGVIVGTDIKYRDNMVITDVTERSSNDRSIFGIKTMFKQDPVKASETADKIIKNTYRTLLTRGMKGCYVYFCDPTLRAHFANQLAVTSPVTKSKAPKLPEVSVSETQSLLPRIEAIVNDNVKYIDFLPLYSLKAACGMFGEGQYVEELGWVKVDGFGRLNRNMFVIKAKGKSMEPTIPDGSYCVFRSNVIGSRNNKIVLVQQEGLYDADNSGSYTIKTYISEKVFDEETGEWQHERIILKPKNPEYKNIIIEEDDNFSVIAEFIGVITE
ncbi:MAG: DNA/RNA helicase domain-containing protein [Bacteroidales bacterium]|jgi:DUF2075 family protein/SOS-response transcriptional repressor LexA